MKFFVHLKSLKHIEKIVQVDIDGDLDLAVANSAYNGGESNVCLLRNNGNRTFAAAVKIASGAAALCVRVAVTSQRAVYPQAAS